MLEILKNLHIDWKGRSLLQDLYMRQEVVIMIANKESDPETMGQRVRQGYPLSFLLFSIYAEVMTIEETVNSEKEIVVRGQLLGDVKFADDQGMVSSSENDLQRWID
jgi:hypothetical protein